METIKNKVGQRIADIRISKGFSQESLAAKAGLHRAYIGKIERGEKNVGIETLEKVAIALEVPLVEFFRVD